MYVYFVAYNFKGGCGHCEVKTDRLIDSYSRVLSVRDSVIENNGLEDLVITNFILLGNESPNQGIKADPNHVVGICRRFLKFIGGVVRAAYPRR